MGGGGCGPLHPPAGRRRRGFRGQTCEGPGSKEPDPFTGDTDSTSIARNDQITTTEEDPRSIVDRTQRPGHCEPGSGPATSNGRGDRWSSRAPVWAQMGTNGHKWAQTGHNLPGNTKGPEPSRPKRDPSETRWYTRGLTGRIEASYGAGEGNRTPDLRFTKPLLCRLSYPGVASRSLRRTVG